MPDTQVMFRVCFFGQGVFPKCDSVNMLVHQIAIGFESLGLRASPEEPGVLPCRSADRFVLMLHVGAERAVEIPGSRVCRVLRAMGIDTSDGLTYLDEEDEEGQEKAEEVVRQLQHAE